VNWTIWWFVRVYVFKWSQVCRELSSAFNCIIDVFSVVELKKCVFSTFSKLLYGASLPVF